MKNLLWFLIILLFTATFLFFSCKDKEPTAPQDTPPEQPLAEKNIGPEGGILETEEFKLEISAGTLSEITELKLYPDKEENPYPDNSLTKRYLLEGFPSDYKNPIKIKIKYTGSLGISNYITFGENVFIPSMAKEDYSDKLIAATDSSGFLKATIPPPDNESQFHKINDTRQSTGWKIKFGGIFSNTEVTTPQGHFKVIWLASGPANIEGMRSTGEYLEKSYSKFLEPDLGFSYEKRTNWPVDVSIMKLDSTVTGYYAPSLRGRNYGDIGISNNYFLNPSVKYICIHEYFNLVADLYDPRPAPFNASILNFQHYWVIAAASTWSEHLFSDDPNYLQSVLAANRNAPFNGFQKGAEGSLSLVKARDHGYGMCGAIFYLAQRYGNGVVKKIFDSIKGGKHPIDAIRIAAESPQLWLENFFRDYLTNSRWNNSQLLSVPYGTLTTITPSTTVVSFDENYPDLSARYFRYSLSGTFKEASELVFTLKNGTAIDNDLTILKKRSGENALLLDYSLDPEIRVNKLADLAKDGYDIICIATNSKAASPYTSVTLMTLEAKLENPEFSQILFTLSLDATIEVKHPDGSSDEYEELKILATPAFYLIDKPSITKSGNTFTESWVYDGINGKEEGSLIVTLNSEHSKVVSYSITNKVSNEVYIKEYTVSCSNADIPSSNPYMFGVKDNNTCKNIESIGYSFKFVGSENIETIKSYNCATGLNFIDIIFIQ